MVVLHDLNLACQYADNLLVIADGTMKASGHPQSIVTPSLIGQTYGVDVEVLRDRRGQPVIQPLRRGFVHSAFGAVFCSSRRSSINFGAITRISERWTALSLVRSSSAFSVRTSV